MDHAGATLYSEQQIDAVAADLKSNIYSNPHTSKETEDLIDQVRYRILQFFNTSSSDYHLVFNRGATDGLKTVAECFDFNGDGGKFAYMQSCHTSVLGMREVVQTKNILPVEDKDLCEIADRIKPTAEESNSLFVYPAQCNFNGFKYDLEFIDKVIRDNNCFVCLDAAAFVGTNFLDLRKYRPDFVTISFYKIFGYPTGLGALLVSKRGESVLKKRYYGGGTVEIAMSGRNFHKKRSSLESRFQDGTVSFLSIISLLHGFRTIDRLIPAINGRSAIDRISNHTFQLAKYLFNELNKLKYNNGLPVVEIYSKSNYQSSRFQGGLLNFNIRSSCGNYVGYSEINCMAEIHNIRLRVGCFCNPGACQAALNLSHEELLIHHQSGHVCGDAIDLFNNVPTGSVRVSFGYMTQQRDVDALVRMIKICYLNQVEITQKSSLIPNDQKDSNQNLILEQICVYPIKSCGPFRIFSSWELTSRGLKYDREWMIINSNGVAVTQKMNTYLCKIRPLIDERRGIMRLTFPGFDPVEVVLEEESNVPRESALCKDSKVCGDRIQGFDCGDTVAAWLDEVLIMDGLRLIRQNVNSKRFVKKSPEMEISLNNAAQFLLINATSVQWLMEHVEEYVEFMTDHEFVGGIVDRFRGNLIVSSSSPLEEKSLTRIEINGNVLEEAGPCTRCQMICIDQRSGEKTTEPLRTIGRLFEGKMRFGMYFKQIIGDKDRSAISCGAVIN